MKKKTLQEHSENYRNNIKPYEEFKRAEDSKGEIIKILKYKARNKNILDIGCGEGSDAKSLAPIAKKSTTLLTLPKTS